MAVSCKKQQPRSMVMFLQQVPEKITAGKTFSCCVTVSIHSAKQRIG
jgi:hypothetical protein